MSDETPVFYPPGTVVSYKDRIAVVVENDTEACESHIRVQRSLLKDGVWETFWTLNAVSSFKLFPYANPPAAIAKKAHLIIALPDCRLDGEL